MRSLQYLTNIPYSTRWSVRQPSDGSTTEATVAPCSRDSKHDVHGFVRRTHHAGNAHSENRARGTCPERTLVLAPATLTEPAIPDDPAHDGHQSIQLDRLTLP